MRRKTGGGSVRRKSGWRAAAKQAGDELDGSSFKFKDANDWKPRNSNGAVVTRTRENREKL